LIQDGGDANRLVIFLAQNPYHFDGLLQLAMLFAKMGQMDRASDLVKRSLYYFECATNDSFREAIVGGLCRLDPTSRANSVYHLTLFRHMQISNMSGMTKTSAELSRLILALDPLGDSYCCLLRIDSQFIDSAQYSAVVDMWASNLPLGLSGDYFSVQPSSPSLTSSVSDLPGWSFSIALALHLQAIGTEAGVVFGSFDAGAGATNMLEIALQRWPFVLNAIAKHSDKMSRFNAVLENSFFRTCRPSSGSVLLHLAEVYGVSSSTIWKRPDLSDLLHATAEKVIRRIESSGNMQSIISKQLLEYDSLSDRAELNKYSSANIEDFLVEYVRFPPDFHPLEPQFQDPELLLGNAENRFRLPNLFQNNNNRRAAEREIMHQIEEAFEEQGINDEHIAALTREILRLHEIGVHNIDLLDAARRLDLPLRGIRNTSGFFLGQRRLDPSLPLLQLFWQTLLPWNDIW
jgi:Transcriptional repressor TCF25